MTTPERLRELAAAGEPRAEITNLFFLSPGEGVTELLLIRHAQIEATMPGDDLALTELGQDQAEVLARHLSHGRIAAVYASPTTRARQTAEPLARIHTCDVEVVDDLRDVEPLRAFDKPILELLTDEFGAEEAPRVLARMQEELTFDAMAPLLESSASFRGRVTAAMDGIIERHRGEVVAVVTHGPVIAIYVASIIRSQQDWPFNPKLTSITRVLAKDGRRTLDFANATPHFDER
jgi:broad specificity phosphatase PhoE